MAKKKVAKSKRRPSYTTRLDPLLFGALQSKAELKKPMKSELGKQLDARIESATLKRSAGEAFAARAMLAQIPDSGREDLLDQDLVPVLVMTDNCDKVGKTVDGWKGSSEQITSRFAAARVPRGKLRNLATMGEVSFVQAGVKLKPSCDLAHRSSGLLGPTGTTRTLSQTGAGVLLGVIDSGIDTNHPAFQNADGSTRIVEYRDQNNGGALFSAAEIDGGAATSPDTNGHGTHVAGIAAGNGARVNGARTRFAGVAPQADLAIVKTSFNSVDIGLAVRQIFDLAESRGQACVVNLSLGGHFGGHDGTSPAETVIDDLSGDGRIVVAAAGNEGSDSIHAGMQLRPGQRDRFQANLRLERQLLDGQELGNLIVQAWTLREDAGVSISLRTPFGDTIRPRRNDSERTTENSFIVDATDQDSPFSGDRSVTFRILALPSLLTGWSLIVEDENDDVEVGSVHAWILDSAMGGFVSGATDSHLVGMPGTATSVLTVAAYATRNQWNSADPARPNVQLGGITLEDIASFSSPGPTRLGENKPDVAAPGQWLASARSAASQRDAVFLQPGGEYVMLQGTSMASPYVAGTVALMLESEPDLNPSQVRRKLISSCSKDGFSGVTWNPTWGHGKLNLQRLLG